MNVILGVVLIQPDKTQKRTGLNETRSHVFFWRLGTKVEVVLHDK